MPEVWKLCEADLSSAKTHNINTRKAVERTLHSGRLLQSPKCEGQRAASVSQITPLRFLYVSGGKVKKKRSFCWFWMLGDSQGFTVYSSDHSWQQGLRAVEDWVRSGAARVLAQPKITPSSRPSDNLLSSVNTPVRGIVINWTCNS